MKNIDEIYSFKSNLKPQHQAFVHAYLETFNATQSAIRAGFSPKTSKVYGYELLQRADIQSEINRITKLKADHVKVEHFQVVEQLVKIAFADITNYMTWSNEGATIIDSDKVDGQVVAEVIVTDKKKTIRLHEKLRALELLGKHIGMFTDKVNINGAVNIQIVDEIADLMNASK